MVQDRHMADVALVRATLAGERAAFGTLVTRYFPAVFALSYAHTGNRLDAEDAAQETFLRALRSLDRLRQAERFAPWLLTIARNVAVDTLAAHVRERKIGPKAFSDYAAWIPDMEKHDLWSKLHEQLENLDESHREVLMLFYFAGHSAREIADLLKTSHVAVRKRLQRAREALGARMLEALEPRRELQPLLNKRATKVIASVMAAPVAWQATAGATAGPVGSAFIGGAAMKWLAGTILVGAGLAGYWATTSHPEDSPAIHSVAPESSADVSIPAQPRATSNADAAETEQIVLAASTKPEEPAPAPPDSGIGVIRGVVETPNHVPIPNAHVLLHRATEDGHWVVDWTEKFRTAISAPDGTFAFEALPFESYDVLAIAGGTLAWVEASVDEHNPQDTVTLRPRAAESLRGVVVNGEGQPVTDAVVYPDRQSGSGLFSCDWHRKAALAERTDENGQFTFPALWTGEWRFNVRAQGYATKTTGYFQTGRGNATIAIDRGSAIRGKVVHTETGDPISGVRVDFFGGQEWDKADTTTDAEGRFEFTRVAPGDRSVRLNDLYWAPVGGLTRISVPAERPADDVYIQAAEGAVVAGRIFDAETRKGVPGVKVWVECRQIDYYRSSEPSDESGFYEITGLAAGAYTVRRGRFIDGYPFPEEPWDPELTLAFGDRVTRDIPMSRGLAISGRVVRPDGAPIRGVELSTFVASDRQQYGHSEADGSFTLMGYRAGDDVTINAEKDGYGLARSNIITMTDGDVSGVEIAMEPQAIVEGVVVDASGRPQSNIKILALAETTGKGVGIIPTTRSDTDGRFALDKLQSDTYAFSVVPRGGGRSVETDTVVFVSGGERVEGVRVVYPAPEGDGRYRISGRVIGEDGIPISGVTVRGENLTVQSFQSANSNDNGEFEMTDLAYVRYNLRVLSSDRQVLGERDGVPAGTTGVEIVVANAESVPGEIVGTVVRADTGAPIPDFEVNPAATVLPVHDPQGRFHLRDVRSGRLPVSVRANGYIDGFALVTVKPSAAGPSEVTVRLQPAARIEGIVRSASGAPVQGARIFADGLQSREDVERLPKVESAEDGTFVLDNLDPRGALIAIKHPSYALLVERVVPSVSGSRVHTFTLDSGGAIAGTVTYDGKPAPNSLVWVYMPDLGPVAGFNGRTGPDGTYRIDGIPPGVGKVGGRLAPNTAGMDTGEFHQTQQVSVREGEITRMDFAFLPHTAALEGVVTIDGQPYDATVSLYVTTAAGHQEMETTADLSGVYQFDAVPPGEANLKVKAWTGFDGESRSALVPVTLSHAAVTRQDVSLVSGASATVRVANQRDGERLSVAAYFGDVGPIETRSDTERAWPEHAASLTAGEDGAYRLTGLQPGTYTIVAHTSTSRNGNIWLNTRAAHQVIDIEGSERTIVDLRLP